MTTLVDIQTKVQALTAEKGAIKIRYAEINAELEQLRQQERELTTPHRCVYAGDDRCYRNDIANGVCEVHADLKNWKMDCCTVGGAICNVRERDGQVYIETEEDLLAMRWLPSAAVMRARGFTTVMYDKYFACGFSAPTWAEAYRLMRERLAGIFY
jgi:hypothetical protein